MRFIVCLASSLNGVFGKYIERISAELLMEGQSLDTATIVEK